MFPISTQFDYPGYGVNQGSPSETSILRNLKDVVGYYETKAETTQNKNQAFSCIGHSVGSVIMLQFYAQQLQNNKDLGSV